MEWFLPLLGGLGLGTLVTKIVDHFLSRRNSREQRLFQEKRDSYIGLLDALSKVAVDPTPEASKHFAYWNARVELFGAPSVAKAIAGMLATNETTQREHRDKFYSQLLNEMRKDLQN